MLEGQLAKLRASIDFVKKSAVTVEEQLNYFAIQELQAKQEWEFVNLDLVRLCAI